MAMMIYTTGNGYPCRCCRRTSQDYTYFDADDIDSLIKECIDISRSNDDDFYINTFEGYDGDETELENRIMSEIKAAEKRRVHQQEIDDLTRQIRDIDAWFGNLETYKADKAKAHDEAKAKLKELGA